MHVAQQPVNTLGISSKALSAHTSHKRRRLHSSSNGHGTIPRVCDQLSKSIGEVSSENIGNANLTHCLGSTMRRVQLTGECTSCHRAFHTTTVLGDLTACSRCSALSCTICARTCTRSMPSLPPTPHLSFSPTPSPTPPPPPRRMALAPSSASMIINTVIDALPIDAWVPLGSTPTAGHLLAHRGDIEPGAASSTTGKRKKGSEDEERDDEMSGAALPIDGVVPAPVAHAQWTLAEGTASGDGPGCGRFVCKACCYEDSKSDFTTCFDCYGS
ncbi:hypothetical protein HGRIS_010599 [Hohenbuehelia grisea]|uniref:Uncharacterized protein n=1 Tax=Hohenbuehelia grisea TaxID=104357 RepID=A0ABR3IX80_9AGAR